MFGSEMLLTVLQECVPLWLLNWLSLVSYGFVSMQLLSPCRSQFSLVCYNSTPTIVFPPVVFPLCNAVNPELLPMAGCFPAVCADWLVAQRVQLCLGHGHLNWVCLKCVLFEVLVLQLLLVYSRNSKECLWRGVHGEEASQGWGGRNSSAGLQKS